MWSSLSVAAVAASMIAGVAADTAAAPTAGPEAPGSYGTCSGASANPWVYNFEVNGYPAKVINDATTMIPVESGVFGEPEPVARALAMRNFNSTAFTFDNNVLYIERPDGGMLIDSGAGPNSPTGLTAGKFRFCPRDATVYSAPVPCHRMNSRLQCTPAPYSLHVLSSELVMCAVWAAGCRMVGDARPLRVCDSLQQSFCVKYEFFNCFRDLCCTLGAQAPC